MKTDVTELDRDVTAAFKVLRTALQPVDGTPEDTALCEIETFCALALMVFKKTNPSKVRSEARTLEIKARMDGIPVVEMQR